jgi:hypothetical protein
MRYATLAESKIGWKHTRKVLATGVVPNRPKIEVCATTGACFVRTVDPTKIIVFRHNGYCTSGCLECAPKHWAA